MTWTLDRHASSSLSRSVKAYPPNPLRPLSFDKANQGKPYNSNKDSSFPIFRLPIELFQYITPYITSQDLETLSLIDRDCHQLARSVQFTNVVMSYSDASLGLLDMLLGEMTPAFASVDSKLSKTVDMDTSTAIDSASAYALGPCIRHVTIDLGPPVIDDSRLARFPNIVLFGAGSSALGLTAEDVYLNALALVLTHALPNLQSISWESRTRLSSRMMEAIMDSPAREVNLTRAVVGSQVLDAFRPHLPSRQDGRMEEEGRKWDLETLKIDVEWVDDRYEDGHGGGTRRGSRDADEDEVTECDVVQEMLSSVAPTLRSFSWKGRDGRNTSGHGYQFRFTGSQALNFPSLRVLSLHNLFMTDSSILEMLLSPRTNICSLTLDCSDYVTARFLETRGYVSSLESFHYKSHPNSTEEGFQDQIVSFLIENPQISSFTSSPRLSSTFIETQLLPVLSSYLIPSRVLTTLHLTFLFDTIPPSSLEAISALQSLQHLWLTAGHQRGWCHDWEIDHSLLLDVLGPLQHLRTLAFTRDSYRVRGGGHRLLDASGSGVSMYYVNKVLPSALDFYTFLKDDEVLLWKGVEDDITRTMASTRSSIYEQAVMADHARMIQRRLMNAAWERWHRGQMVLVVKEYAMRFLGLEWCFVGQLPFRVGWEVPETLYEERKGDSSAALDWGLEKNLGGSGTNAQDAGVTRITIESAFRCDDASLLKGRWERCCGLL
ncbi:hypothetical protein D9758_005014 [Tetrapyrgos nigripes]|uniref:F-box domain-containing protein n=1 Tax=Tetrapyrgos nigripes TaxID=182062 RepID=A0A8H5GVL5_9AGAR|nr:hypothetical protein D9758_005014 [Tetrapyrgos nigripes]